MPRINHLKIFNISSMFSNSKILQGTLGNGKYFSKDIVKNDITQEKNKIQIPLSKDDTVDQFNIEYKNSPYLKPLDIKGIKRAYRYIDYNSSYNFIKKQNDFKENEVKQNLKMKLFYDGSKVPLPPKKFKISQYVDTRLDLISPFVLAGIISLPFFFASNMI